jgi:hypothetical protein
MPVRFFLLPTCALLFVCSLGTCRANLGETESQCVARYGHETGVQTDVGYRQVGDKAVTFLLKMKTTSVDIKVIFLHGRSCHETFSNDDSSQGLSEDQMKSILDSQSAGLKWRKVNSMFHTNGVDSSGTTYGIEKWQRSDGATGTFWLSGKADTQTYSGQVDVSTREYTVAQRYYDQQNGDP